MAMLLFELSATVNTGDVVVIVVIASVTVLVTELDDCLVCSDDLLPRLFERLLELVEAVVVAFAVAVLVADTCYCGIYNMCNIPQHTKHTRTCTYAMYTCNAHAHIHARTRTHTHTYI